MIITTLAALPGEQRAVEAARVKIFNRGQPGEHSASSCRHLPGRTFVWIRRESCSSGDATFVKPHDPCSDNCAGDGGLAQLRMLEHVDVFKADPWLIELGGPPHHRGKIAKPRRMIACAGASHRHGGRLNAIAFGKQRWGGAAVLPSG